MRQPTRDGSYAEPDDDIYSDVPVTKRLKRDELLALVDQVIDGKDADGIMLAGALATDWDRVSPEVEEAYAREAKRIASLLSTSLGAPIVSKVEEVGFIGYRWTVRGVPVVLAPYQEDSDLPLELFLMRVTPATKIYLAPSLTGAATKAHAKSKASKKAPKKPRASTKPSKKPRRSVKAPKKPRLATKKSKRTR